MTSVILSEVKSGLGILHGQTRGFREFRLIDPARGQAPVIRYFSTSDPVEVICEWLEREGEGLNVYVGRSPRRADLGVEAGASSDILWATAISIDIDPGPVGPDCTRELGQRLAGVLGGAVIDSGRGTQVWLPFTEPYDAQGRQAWFTEACKRWEADIVLRTFGKWETDEYRIDRQHDLARIVRVPGTVNCKTGRMGSVLCGPKHGLAVSDILRFSVDGRWGADQGGRWNLGGLDSGGRAVPSRFWRVLAGDQRLREAWTGQRADITDTSGSGQDMALVARLRSLRFSPEEALAILRAKPNKGRARDEYFILTIQKAYSG